MCTTRFWNNLERVCSKSKGWVKALLKIKITWWKKYQGTITPAVLTSLRSKWGEGGGGYIINVRMFIFRSHVLHVTTHNVFSCLLVTFTDHWHVFKNVFRSHGYYITSIYSLTCIKRSHLGQRKSGLIRQMTS